MQTQKIEKPIPYPRRRLIRFFVRWIFRGLLKILTRTTVIGMDNIPGEGSVILAGNHVAALEAGLMTVLPPRMVELLGAADMPFEPGINLLVRLYGHIPINRGNLDRSSIHRALQVLNQDGVLGIFPEGGTWNPGHMPAQIGVALLSDLGHSRVVPIGFSGMHHALKKVFHFERPPFVMRVGSPIPPLTIPPGQKATKEIYQQYADKVLEHINALVDPADLHYYPQHSTYVLEMRLGEVGSDVQTEEKLTEGLAFAHLLFQPVMLNSLLKNLRLPVKVFYPDQEKRTIASARLALQAILDYLKINPAFFTYRFGMQEGQALALAMEALLEKFDAAQEFNQQVFLKAEATNYFHDGRVEKLVREYLFLPD